MTTIEFAVPTARILNANQVIAQFVIDGEPISKARARFTNYRSPGRVYTPEKTREGEDKVKAAFLKAHPKSNTDKHVAYGVAVRFLCGTRQRRDIDNMAKLILDALNGLAWVDDIQVLELTARKSFVTKEQACTEVIIYIAGDMGYPAKPCAHCGERVRTYPSIEKLQKYCNRECELAHRRAARTIECEHCGKSFEAHGTVRETRFCSIACKAAFGRVDIPCDYCGQIFSRQKSWVHKRNFCTPECRVAAPRLNRELSQVRGTCQDCGGPTSKRKYLRCRDCNYKANTRWPKSEELQ